MAIPSKVTWSMHSRLKPEVQPFVIIVGSFSRLGLSFLAHLDPADAYQVFPEELVNYRKAMETDIVYDVTLMEYSEFA